MLDIININFNIFNKGEPLFIRYCISNSLFIAKVCECLDIPAAMLVEVSAKEYSFTLAYNSLLNINPVIESIKNNKYITDITVAPRHLTDSLHIKINVIPELFNYLIDDSQVSMGIYKTLLLIKFFENKPNAEFMSIIEGMHFYGTLHEASRLLDKPRIKKQIDKYIKGFTLDTLDDILALEGYLLTCNTV